MRRSMIGPSHAPVVTKASRRIQRYLFGPSLCIKKILNTHGGRPPIASVVTTNNTNNDISTAKFSKCVDVQVMRDLMGN